MVKNKLKIIAATLALSLAMTGCSSDVYEGPDSEYTEVTTVKPTNFEVPSNLLLEATAISSISNSEEYNGLFVYKDGKSKYVLFNTKSIVVACGPTSFNFKGNENLETLKSKSVEGIWMSADDLDYDSLEKDGVYKLITDKVNAEYSLTPTQYCNLQGYFATVSDGKTEYSLFAGAVVQDGKNMSSQQSRILKHIAKTFAFNKQGAKELIALEKEEAKEKEQTEKAAMEKEKKLTAKANEEELEELPKETPEKIEDESSEDELEDDTVEMKDVPQKDKDDETKDPEEETKDSKKIEDEDTKKESKDNEKTESKEESTEDTDSDKEQEEDKKKAEPLTIDAKKSTVYKPLNIGEWGKASCMNTEGKQDNINVKVDAIYSGEEATDLIKKFNGRKPKAKEGTSFVVVEYTSDVSEDDGLLDIAFCGVDGERLKLRGVSYTTRTFNLYKSQELGTEYKVPTYIHRYAYYEVPTRTKEYMLVFGIRGRNTEMPTANYLIKVEE